MRFFFLVNAIEFSLETRKIANEIVGGNHERKKKRKREKTSPSW